ncbi:MAG: DUF1707 SHOCT-like domain-containing protein [Micromonosporaceae bacterium]
MSTDSAEGGARVRASDAEREEYARAIREAVGEGRLSLDEGDERLTRVYAVRYRDELRPLVTDLPREEGWGPTGGRHGGPGRGRGPGGRGADPGSGSASGSGSGPGFGPGSGPGFGPGHGWGPWRRGLIWRAVPLLILLTIVLLAAGSAHFFWPIIPLFFLSIFLIKGFCFLGWRRRAWRDWAVRQGSGWSDSPRA